MTTPLKSFAKHFRCINVLRFICIIGISTPFQALAIDVEFLDEKWTGKKIPKGQHCQKFGGHGESPPLRITNLPTGTEVVILEFSDIDSTQMKNGGHGKIGMKVPTGATTVEFPAVPGHTFELPDGIFMVRAHRSPSWDRAGAYLPPCSGGQGNNYYVTVKAAKIKNFEKKKFKKIDKRTLKIGQY